MRTVSGTWSLWEVVEDTSGSRVVGLLIFGLFTVTGLRWLFGWIWLRPEAGVPFVASGWWQHKDPTWNVLLKLTYWAIAITLYFVALEVFFGLLVYQGVMMCWHLRTTFSDAVREKGVVKGVFVGLWRAIPIVLEPLFFNDIKAAYKRWIVKEAPANSSLTRYLPDGKDPDPPPDLPPTKAVKRERGSDKRMLKKWEGKNIPLPHAEQDVYGLKPGKVYVVDYVLEEHDAFDVGKHWDFRWWHPTFGVVDAVALPKHKYPELGKPVLAVKSDAGHGHAHLKNLPFKATGYGAGHTKTLQEGKMRVWVDPETRHLHVLTDKGDAFAFVKGNKSGEKDWLMVRLSDSPKGGVPAIHRERKMNLKDISRHTDEINSYARQGYFGEKKYDGAMFWLTKDGKGRVWLVSRRPAHENNTPVKIGNDYKGIDRAYWVPAVQNLDDTELPRNTSIQVEVLSLGKGQYSSSHARTAAVLNMGPASSLEEQQKNGFLIVKMLKVEHYKGEDWSRANPMQERHLREMLGRGSHRVLHVPKARFTPKGIADMYSHEVKTGGEGIVLKHMTDPEAPMLKAKVTQTWDFRINSIHPVRDKRSSTVRSRKEAEAVRRPGSKWLPGGVPLGAGYIAYTTDAGAVGKAGSGLTDEQRRDMWNNPEAYLGKGNVEFKNGAYYAIDPDKVPVEVEVKGMSRSETTGIVRAPVVERIRFDK